MNTLISRLGGKKLIVALTGVLAVILSTKLGLSEEQVKHVLDAIALICAAFGVGQGIADGLSGGATSHVATTPDSKDAG
jgi:hypothetical protein